MSNFRNFIDDFPGRCRDVLHLTREKAVDHDREVTLALMVASTGFLVPFERLRDDGAYSQPTRDRTSFPEAAANLESLLAQSWADSPFGKTGTCSWSSGLLQSPEKTIDDWPELQGLQPLQPAATVGSIIIVIRHALAHGNIYTLPNPQRKIQAIVFVCGGENKKTGKKIPYKFVYVSPDDFHSFLLTWFDILASWKLPQKDVQEALEKAA